MTKTTLIPVALGILLAACASSAPIPQVGILPRDHIVALSEGIGARPAGSRREARASEYISNALESYGYAAERRTFTRDNPSGIGAVQTANVVSVKEGRTERRILVGAHYDSAHTGKGADDNASGVAILLDTAKSLKGQDTPYTMVFIAFGAEEPGFLGSSQYVEEMTRVDRANTIVIVNLDSLIAGDYAYVYGGEGVGGEIRDWLLAWAEIDGLGLQTQPGENPEFPAGTTGDWSDHVPFKEAGIPYVYFESTNWSLGAKDGYTQVDPQLGVHGEIWNTKYDNLRYIDDHFPGRVDERLALFGDAVYRICTKYEVPLN